MYSVELYARVRRACHVEGLSERAAARLFGIDRKTVSKILKHSVPPGYRRSKPPARPKLDPFLPIIDQILEADRALPKKQRHTAQRIFEKVRDEHGFTGGVTIVTDYIREKKRRTQEVFVPLSHPPGHAQVDFGEALGEIGGVRCKLHYFAMALPHSDAIFIKAYPAETTEAFCDGHVAAFAFFGGVPLSILFDNTTLAVAKRPAFSGAGAAGPRSRPSPEKSPAAAATARPSSACAMATPHEQCTCQPEAGALRDLLPQVHRGGLDQDFNSLDAQHEACAAYTAERIRDKIAASKARGMWMGGVVPIGYHAEARSLVPEPEDAALVRRIFHRYLALGSVTALRADLTTAGIRTPERRHRSGRVSGGGAFSRGQLYAMLTNPIYIGRIRHKGTVHPGQHAAILDMDLWEAVQQRLAEHRRRRTSTCSTQVPSPLAGRLVDPDGRKMRPSHASKKGRRYRYCVSAPLIEDGVAHGARGWRIPAGELEAAVARALAAKLREPAFQSKLVGSDRSGTDRSATAIPRLLELAELLEAPASATGRNVLNALITRVELTETELRAEASFAQLGDAEGSRLADLSALELASFSVAAPLRLQRRGPGLRLVLGGAAAAAPAPDPLLLQTLVEARCRASDYLDPDQDLTVSDIAHREGCDVGDASRSLQLAFLAPDLIEQILDGTQPVALTAERLKRLDLPLLWEDQRAVLA